MCSFALSFCGQNPSGSSAQTSWKWRRAKNTSASEWQHSICREIYNLRCLGDHEYESGEPSSSSSSFWFSDDPRLHYSGLCNLNLEMQYRQVCIPLPLSVLSCHVSCACLTVMNKIELHVLSLKIHWKDKKSLWVFFSSWKSISFQSNPTLPRKWMLSKVCLAFSK